LPSLATFKGYPISLHDKDIKMHDMADKITIVNKQRPKTSLDRAKSVETIKIKPEVPNEDYGRQLTDTLRNPS